MHSVSDRCDVLIVGARCAGSATAILLARAGFDVRIIDRASEIGDTLSTHALMRPGVAMLDRLGVLPRIVAAATPAITRTRFAYGTADILDIAVKPMGDIPGLYAPRRYVLDRILSEAAVEAGALLSLGTRFENVLRDRTGRVVGAEVRLRDGSRTSIRAGLVIGADGRGSRVAEAVGARTIRSDPHRASMVFGYFDGIPNEGFRWLFDEGLQVGVIPTNGGRHCVFASCRPDAFAERLGNAPLSGIADSLAVWEPDIAADLARSGRSEPIRRFAGIPGFIRDCAGPGWALVGDAGCFMDPATAHGLSEALLDAGRLAASVVDDPTSLDGYAERRSAQVGTIFGITQRVASFDWNLDDLVGLHRDLNDAMRREFAGIADGLSSLDRAAPAPPPLGAAPGPAGGEKADDRLRQVAMGGMK